MVAEDMSLLRDAYKVPSDIELLLPDPNERACFPRRGCTALSLNAFVSGMRLPLHLFFRRILREYGLAPTQVSPNGWGQMVGGLYQWFRHSFGMEMPLHVFQTMYQPRKLPRKKGKDEEPGWYYFCPWGPHKPLVTENLSSVKQWKEAWFWVTGNWQRVEDDPEPDLDVPNVYGIDNSLPRCELSREVVEVLRSIYQAPPATQRYEFILNRHRCLIDLGLMMMDKDKRPRPALARLSKQKPRALAPSSSEESRQKKVLEDLSRQGSKETAQTLKVIKVEDSAPEGDVPLSRKRKTRAPGSGASQGSVEIVDDPATCSVPPLQRTLAINTSGEVVLEAPPRLSQKTSGPEGNPYESKRRLRELIGASGARIPDDVLRNVPFFPSMGAQAVKKYLTPKWEEFSSHGDLEDVLEASLASAIRASALQMKVLGESRTRMQEQRRLSTAASKSDKEHKQALEGLQVALDSARMAYEQLEADLKESDSNVLNLTKHLDNTKAAQKCLRGDLDSSESSRREAESNAARLLGEKKEMEERLGSVEAKLENADAEFVANFHNTEAYTNFSDYFARVGQQEVLTVLKKDYPDFDIGLLEARFPPPDAGSEDDS
ncbi:Plus3 domain-containing protein [Abeliophyllum distichum]|uniref:Plus3 domain-containing protein n=1 Tax=Abeliophyllum distichum TaxID=126358 RepID=A0ABD1TIA2_9LAMI